MLIGLIHGDSPVLKDMFKDLHDAIGGEAVIEHTNGGESRKVNSDTVKGLLVVLNKLKHGANALNYHIHRVDIYKLASRNLPATGNKLPLVVLLCHLINEESRWLLLRKGVRDEEVKLKQRIRKHGRHFREWGVGFCVIDSFNFYK